MNGAQEMYERVIALQPDFYDAIINLGVLARSRQQHDEAEQWYRRAIATRPDIPLGYDNLARLLIKLGHASEALEILSLSVARALREDSENVAMHSLRARLMLILGDKAGAVAVYKDWLAAFPDSNYARHMLAAASGDNVPHTSDPRYVKELFDGFSESFDEVLDRIHYSAPNLVGACVAEAFDSCKNSLEVLDAGCGTGLGGQYLRPYTNKLSGLDISPGMLSKARVTEHYDELFEDEIVAYFSSHPTRYDLIVSADALNNFGDISALFTAAKTTLKPEGTFIFTLETHENQSDEDYVLNLHGRYSHSSEYIQAVMQGAGLDIVSSKEVVLREERGEPVH